MTMCDLDDDLAFLDRFQTAPLVRERFPREGREYQLESCGIGSGTKQKLLDSLSIWRAQREVASVPIVGVCGELNVGKSSVVAGFLSPSGQDRILRGIGGSEGTQRFVYWLPAAWEGTPAFDAFLTLLEKAHETSDREPLSDTPGEAHNQYRGLLQEGRDPRLSGGSFQSRDAVPAFQRPLIAFDEGLNRYRLALLDCPDVQRDPPEEIVKAAHAQGMTDPEEVEEWLEEVRMEFVAKAARLCSAFLYVWSRRTAASKTAAGVMKRVRGVMPSTRLFLLLNELSVRHGEPYKTLIDDEVRKLTTQAERTFVALTQSDTNGWRECVPEPLRGELPDCAELNEDPIPFFFDPGREGSSPETLLQTLSKLDASELRRDAIESHRSTAKDAAKDAVKDIERWVNNTNESHFAVQEALLYICTQAHTNAIDDSPIVPLRRGFMSKVERAFCDTADFYIRPQLVALGWFRGGAEAARSWAKRQWANMARGEGVSSDANAPTGLTTFDPSRLAGLTANYRPFDDLGSDRIDRAWQNAFETLVRYDDQPDDREIRDIASKVWADTPWMRKAGLAGANLLALAANAAALAAIPFDGGMLALVTVPVAGLLGVGVFVGGGPAAEMMTDYYTKSGTLPSLTVLYRAACSEFGASWNQEDARDKKKLKVTFGTREYDLPDVSVKPGPVLERLLDLRRLEITNEFATLKGQP